MKVITVYTYSHLKGALRGGSELHEASIGAKSGEKILVKWYPNQPIHLNRLTD